MGRTHSCDQKDEKEGELLGIHLQESCAYCIWDSNKTDSGRKKLVKRIQEEKPSSSE